MKLGHLNEQQLFAVTDSFEHNTATIAGAGSGKTTVLTDRIAFLIEELEVEPHNIMAVTFTKKAANEMKERVERNVGSIDGLYIGTFHSICATLLRKFASGVGLQPDFTILDVRDCRYIMKEILKGLMLESKLDDIKYYLAEISNLKNNCIGPKKLLKKAKTDDDVTLAKVYAAYVSKCYKCNTLDYDDLISYAIAIFREPYVVEWFKKNIHYLLVDEYQDVNYAQYVLVKKIIGDNNLFVVGDPKQSIYGFRSSDPSYLENFSKMFDNTKVMYLDRNYRSTQNIVNGSNSLIKANPSNFENNSFTKKEEGEKILIHEAYNVFEEAEHIASKIEDSIKSGTKYSDIAILYRNHSQSGFIEKQLIESKIPYVIYNGTSFFKREEIVNIFSFIKFKANSSDEASFERSLKQLPGIGKKMTETIIEFCNKNGVNYYTGLIGYTDKRKSEIKSKNSATIKNLENAVAIYGEILEYICTDISEFVRYILKRIDFKNEMLKNISKKSDKDKEIIIGKIENVEEFVNIIASMQEENPELTLDNFIEEIALLSQEDVEEKDQVKLMTVHSSKGLEFKEVMLCGVEEGIMPGFRCVPEGEPEDEDIYEERRLMYVAMTRAKEKLSISHCKYRKRGENSFKVDPSRFLKQIDTKYVEYSSEY